MLSSALNAPEHPSYDTVPSVAAPALSAAPAASAVAADFDENNSYKVYIVLQWTRNKSKSRVF